MIVYGEILSTFIINNQQPSNMPAQNPINLFQYICRCGGMVDTQDLGSCAEKCVGSNPIICTRLLFEWKMRY